LTAKKTILVLVDWFLPGYLAGGPIQAIANLTQHLGNDFDFKIITTDRDFRTQTPYVAVVTNSWTVFEGRNVFYISDKQLHTSFILNLIQNTPHDVIYLNSMFSKLFSIDILQAKAKKQIKSPIILAPRGMLGAGALAIKPIKKKLFLYYAKIFGLYRNIHWQATSQQETNEIRKQMGSKVFIYEMSDLPQLMPENAILTNKIIKNANQLRLCFISRISEKKNLHFAIDVLREIKDCQIVYDVYGPIEDPSYWNMCVKKAKMLTENIQFAYKDSLKPNQVGEVLRQYHALFLPTHNENYGYIIVETLQNARMVVLSDQTPWRNLAQEKVGFDIPLTQKQAFVDAIRMLCQYKQTEFDVASNTCYDYIKTRLRIEDIKKQYVEMFQKV
jgi:glycosyltransferase involved in cell wall biosynthesis